MGSTSTAQLELRVNLDFAAAASGLQTLQAQFQSLGQVTAQVSAAQLVQLRSAAAQALEAQRSANTITLTETRATQAAQLTAQRAGLAEQLQAQRTTDSQILQAQRTAAQQQIQEAHAKAAAEVQAAHETASAWESAAGTVRGAWSGVMGSIGHMAGGYMLGNLLYDGLEKAVTGFKDAVTGAVDYNTQLNYLQTNTGATTAQIGLMDAGVRSVMASTNLLSGAAMEAERHISDFGFKGADNVKIMTVAADAAVASGASLAETAQLTAGALHAYGAPAELASRFLNVMTIAAQRGNETLPQFSENAGRAIGVAAVLGLNITEVASALSTLTAHNYGAAQSQTALVNVMTHMAGPTKAQKEEIASLDKHTGLLSAKGLTLAQSFTNVGISTNGLSGNFDLLNRMYDKLGLSQAARADETARLMSAQRGELPLILLLTAGNADYKATLDQAGQALAGVLTPNEFAAARAQQTLGVQVGELGNKFRLMGQTVMDTAGGPLTVLVTGLNNVATNILGGNWSRAWLGMGQIARTALDDVAGAIPGLRGVTDFLEQHFDVVLAGAGAVAITFGASMVAGLLPVVAPLALVAAAGVTLYEVWVNDFGGVQEITARVWADVGPTLTALGQAVGTLTAAFGSGGLQGALDALPGVLAPLTAAAGQAMNALGDLVAQGASALWAWIAPQIGPTLNALVDWAGAAGGWLLSTGVDVLTRGYDALAPGVWQWIKDSMGDTLAALDAWAKGAKSYLDHEGRTQVLSGTDGWADKIANFIGDAPGVAAKAFRNWMSGEVIPWFQKEGLPAMLTWGIALGDAVVAGVRRALANLGPDLQSLWNQATGGPVQGPPSPGVQYGPPSPHATAAGPPTPGPHIGAGQVPGYAGPVYGPPSPPGPSVLSSASDVDEARALRKAAMADVRSANQAHAAATATANAATVDRAAGEQAYKDYLASLRSRTAGAGAPDAAGGGGGHRGAKPPTAQNLEQEANRVIQALGQAAIASADPKKTLAQVFDPLLDVIHTKVPSALQFIVADFGRMAEGVRAGTITKAQAETRMVADLQKVKDLHNTTYTIMAQSALDSLHQQEAAWGVHADKLTAAAAKARQGVLAGLEKIGEDADKKNARLGDSWVALLQLQEDATNQKMPEIASAAKTWGDQISNGTITTEQQLNGKIAGFLQDRITKTTGMERTWYAARLADLQGADANYAAEVQRANDAIAAKAKAVLAQKETVFGSLMGAIDKASDPATDTHKGDFMSVLLKDAQAAEDAGLPDIAKKFYSWFDQLKAGQTISRADMLATERSFYASLGGEQDRAAAASLQQQIDNDAARADAKSRADAAETLAEATHQREKLNARVAADTALISSMRTMQADALRATAASPLNAADVAGTLLAQSDEALHSGNQRLANSLAQRAQLIAAGDKAALADLPDYYGRIANEAALAMTPGQQLAVAGWKIANDKIREDLAKTAAAAALAAQQSADSLAGSLGSLGKDLLNPTSSLLSDLTKLPALIAQARAAGLGPLADQMQADLANAGEQGGAALYAHVLAWLKQLEQSGNAEVALFARNAEQELALAQTLRAEQDRLTADTAAAQAAAQAYQDLQTRVQGLNTAMTDLANRPFVGETALSGQQEAVRNQMAQLTYQIDQARAAGQMGQVALLTFQRDRLSQQSTLLRDQADAQFSHDRWLVTQAGKPPNPEMTPGAELAGVTKDRTELNKLAPALLAAQHASQAAADQQRRDAAAIAATTKAWQDQHTALGPIPADVGRAGAAYAALPEQLAPALAALGSGMTDTMHASTVQITAQALYKDPTTVSGAWATVLGRMHDLVSGKNGLAVQLRVDFENLMGDISNTIAASGARAAWQSVLTGMASDTTAAVAQINGSLRGLGGGAGGGGGVRDLLQRTGAGP